MIRKLRRKFILVFMGVASALLAALLIGLYLSNAAHYRQMTVEALGSALMEGRRARGGVPLIVAEDGPDGQVCVLFNQIFFITEEEIAAAVMEVRETGQEMGELPARNLRFLCHRTGPSGMRVAFADIYGEKASLHAQLASSAVIGGVALLGFLLLSVALSRWIVRPVEEAWKKQRQFVADASHELKTPLTVALSNVDMALSIQGSFPDEKNRRRLDIAETALLRMKDLVEKLLTLARGDAEEGEADAASFVPIDLTYLLSCSTASFEPVFFDAGRCLRVEIAPGCQMMGSAGKLLELFGILLDNACKYSAPGSTVTVRLEREGGRICLAVENDGDGIPPEALPRVFERFFRVDPSRGEIAGCGLGLSIAEEIVSRHGGKIWAESAGGHTGFYVRFFK